MIINDETREKLKEILSDINGNNKIKLIFFKSNINCETCKTMELLLKEIKEISDVFDLEIYNRYTDVEKSNEYSVKMTPALFFENSSGRKKIVLYGFPGGYEFITLIEILKYIGGKDVEFDDNIKNEISSLEKDSNIKVFVTPTCPYCPHAAISAVKFALLSDKISTEIVVVNEFPELVEKYQIEGVPKTVINDKIHLEGARSEIEYINALKSSF